MRLQFRTSVASASRHFMEGRTIDVPARTRDECEAWLEQEPEFREWIAQGVVAVLSGPLVPEVAALDPLGETAALAHPRLSRGSGRGRRSSSRRLAPA